MENELHHSCNVFSNLMKSVVYENVMIDDVSDDEVEPTSSRRHLLFATPTGACQNLLVFDTIVQADEIFDMENRDNWWVEGKSDLISNPIVCEKSDIGSGSMPYSAIMGSISHEKVVNILKSVDRCFQLLEPESVAALEPSCESELLMQRRKMSGTLDFTHVVDLVDTVESGSSVLIDRTNSDLQGDDIMNTINRKRDFDSLVQLNKRDHAVNLAVPPSLTMLATVSCCASTKGRDERASKESPGLSGTLVLNSSLSVKVDLPLPTPASSYAESLIPGSSGWEGPLSPPHSGISDPCIPAIPLPSPTEAITPTSSEPVSEGSTHFSFTDESVKFMGGITRHGELPLELLSGGNNCNLYLCWSRN